jgi:diaminopropionate ammonia-lyase
VQGILNASVRRDTEFRGHFTDAELRDAHAYFAAHPELVPTPLHLLPTRAAALGLRLVSVKDESRRHGVNAFKIMGVRYAVHRVGDGDASRGLVCATTGNHGRAVARVARAKQIPCTVFVPAPRRGALPAAEQQTRDARIAAMQADAASVVLVEGAYEDAVRRASDHAATTGATILSDTSWPGYDEIPRWIMAGYTQIFEEAYNQWDRPPDVILVQGGVGGLICAAVNWAAWRFGPTRPRIVSCEPDRAACLLESAAAGAPVALEHELDTIMAGLRCAEVSPAAWPSIRDGVDAFVSVPDELVLETMASLASPPGEDPAIQAGPSGACSMAATTALARAPDLKHLRAEFGVDGMTHAFAVVTEGP